MTIGAEALDGIVRITIADTGLGMSQAQLAGLFQPFNRLGREHRAIAGAGIGMALVRQLVELIGGSVSVASEEGVGTTAWVDLVMLIQHVVERWPDVAAAKAFGAVDYWTKPMVAETFRRKMSKLLEASPVQRRVP